MSVEMHLSILTAAPAHYPGLFYTHASSRESYLQFGSTFLVEPAPHQDGQEGSQVALVHTCQESCRQRTSQTNIGLGSVWSGLTFGSGQSALWEGL